MRISLLEEIAPKSYRQLPEVRSPKINKNFYFVPGRTLIRLHGNRSISAKLSHGNYREAPGWCTQCLWGWTLQFCHKLIFSIKHQCVKISWWLVKWNKSYCTETKMSAHRQRQQCRHSQRQIHKIIQLHNFCDCIKKKKSRKKYMAVASWDFFEFYDSEGLNTMDL